MEALSPQRAVTQSARARPGFQLSMAVGVAFSADGFGAKPDARSILREECRVV